LSSLATLSFRAVIGRETGLKDAPKELLRKRTSVGSSLGWRFRIRTDMLEGRIRTDSGGFRAAPQLRGIFCRLYGHFDPIKIDSGFGRIRMRTDSDGFLDPKYGSHQPRPASPTREQVLVRLEEQAHVLGHGARVHAAEEAGLQGLTLVPISAQLKLTVSPICPKLICGCVPKKLKLSSNVSDVSRRS
jgi:hypothetical protein